MLTMFADILPIVRKELKSYFNSPIAYIVVVSFLLFSSLWLFFLQQFFAANTASLRMMFAIFPLIFIIVMPALTMRSWAEEKKLGTMEVLMTLPYREDTLVLGKFLAAGALLLIMVALTLPIPLLLSRFGSFDWGEICGQYLGALLVGGSGIAVGLFISSLAANQISAFILSLFILLIMTMISQVNRIFPVAPWAAAVFNYLSLDTHYDAFQRGLIDSRDLAYYLIVICTFLYLNVQSLIFRKWS
jgi:ABC-2 type transport system permease protein